jgi:peptidoglycan hydrolase CwlO-like protein
MYKGLLTKVENARSTIGELVYCIEQLESERDELRQHLDTANERIQDLEKEIEELNVRLPEEKPKC